MCILREGFGWLGATQKLINLFFSWYFLASEILHIRDSWLYSLLLLGCVGDSLAPWLALCISSEYFFPFELRWAYPTHILSSVVSYLVLCIVAVAVAVARSRSRLAVFLLLVPYSLEHHQNQLGQYSFLKVLVLVWFYNIKLATTSK